MLFCGGATAAAAAEPLQAQIAAAARLYGEGRSQTAQASLAELLAASDMAAGDRLEVLEALLDICIHSYADACVRSYAPAYAETAGTVVAVDPALHPLLARKTVNYLDQARFTQRSAEISRQLLDHPLWTAGPSTDEALNIERLVLVANVRLSLDDPAATARAIDDLLGAIAAATAPQDARFTLASALADAVFLLLDLGETERAYGIVRASGEFIGDALPPLTVDAVVYHVAYAQLMQEMGRPAASLPALDQAIAVASAIEMDDATRSWLLGSATAMKATACAQLGRLDCAREALARHPSAPRFVRAGGQPQGYDDVVYLAARALVGAYGQADDPIAAAALAAPQRFETVPSMDALLGVYRTAGAALAQPPGDARADGLFEAGRRAADAASRRGQGPFGAWYRPGAVDQMILSLALTQVGRDSPDADTVAFALFQLAGRTGPSYDADALTALSQAGDEAERRAVHQALRLRARRDRLERDQLQRVAAAASAPRTDQPLALQPAVRRRFGDLAAELDASGRALAAGGISTSGANLVDLRTFQASLRPNEAAVAVAPVPGGVAYMCIRRETTLRRVAAADLRQLTIDSRMLQAALTAGHAPSDALDAQFPVQASVRLYDVLIRPIEDCLKPGDHLIWLPAAALTPAPLSVLLDAAPPALGDGYDLAQANWLIKRHAISYAGSASLVVAARGPGARAAAKLDFLGIGDPRLSGATPGGQERAKILTQGSGLSTLAALPETAAELRASAQGFRGATILTGDAATERAARAALAQPYRYISFATHGLLREELPGLSEPALAMTPVDGADPDDDGLLTASDIADLSLAARFVALSACNTANFDLAQMSQELPALASAFAVAGAPATLGTLWAVDSESSKRIVSGVFAGLRDGEASPAEALADSQRAYLAAPPSRAHLHPRFWAPFVMLGDGGAAR